MDRIQNPFAPGAGNQPPELAGREAILERADLTLRRVHARKHEKSQMLLGLRGVGKTVLLNKIETMAVALDAITMFVEAPESKRLAELLIPALRKSLLKLDKIESAKALARRGLGGLRNFASAFKVAIAGVEVGVTPEAGVADSGQLTADLPELLILVAEAADAANTIAVLLIDEVQYLSEDELAALIVAAHKISQKQLPFVIFGAGLPQLAGLAGESKSYAERLFDYPEVGPLRGEDARNALVGPIRKAGADISQDALEWIVHLTQGYPYFLQEWGYQAWNASPSTLITAEVAQNATENAIARLDEGFFRVRFDRLTPREKDYMRAMAELGAGPHRSGDIAKALGNEVRQVAPLRGTLIAKGMIYSPAHGDTAFTVPMFDEFLKRTIPEAPQPRGRR